MVDGTALRSCRITLAEAEGRFITTIEGLARDRSHPMQQAMVAEQAIQCGFCTPGIVMAGAASASAQFRSRSKAEIEERYLQSVPLRGLPAAGSGRCSGQAA